MTAYIKRTIDYTFKRKGDKIFTIVNEAGEYLNFGCWKSKKACKEAFYRNPFGVQGYELEPFMATEHKNYSHWADFEFVK